ncbi:MAG: copper resistance protein CopC [Acidobacteriaceae bacterium]
MKRVLASILKESRLRWLWLGGFFAMCMAVQSLGQGCSQCLDSTRATPPSVQAAYRHAIFLLGGAGATLFITGTLLLRRQR